jgi:unsaturated rhamnogalacturonyl hydrolase
MRHAALLAAVAVLLSAAPSFSAAPPSPDDVAAVMKRAFDWEVSGGLQDPVADWRQATFMAGVVASYEATHDAAYLDEALAWADSSGWRIPDPLDADDLCVAQVYLDLARVTRDTSKTASSRAAIDSLVRAEPRRRPIWWWSDALFMAPPAMARLSSATGDTVLLGFLNANWRETVGLLYDTDAHLFYRDERAKGERTRSGAPIFWSRGNGWVLAGLARTLAFMPPERPERAAYASLFRDMAAAVVARQGDDGLWRSSLLGPLERQPGETSGSGLLCYALAWGINAGVLDREAYLPAVTRAWRGLAGALDEEGRLGWVQGVDRGPGPAVEDATAPYGVGALLLAGSEVIRFDRRYLALTPDGAWSWFSDPRAFCRAETLFAGWVSGEGRIEIATHGLSGDRVDISDIAHGFDADDHAYPALAPTSDGRLTAFYSTHGGAGTYVMYRVTERPGDVTTWGHRQFVRTNTDGDAGATYANVCPVAGRPDSRFLLWRGADWNPAYSLITFRPDLSAWRWSQAQPLLLNPTERPYARYASGEDGRVAVAFTDGHPREIKNNVYYFALAPREDGVYEYVLADGTVLGEMDTHIVTTKEAGIVFDRDRDPERTGGNAWIWDVAFGQDGRPVVAYASFPSKSHHQYHWARFDGRRWDDHLLVEDAGGSIADTTVGYNEYYYSGGIALDPVDPSIVYVSRENEVGGWDLQQMRTPDDGDSWTVEPLTSGSREKNVRPPVPLGRAAGTEMVLWMNGSYTNYNDFDTGIMLWTSKSPLARATDRAP